MVIAVIGHADVDDSNDRADYHCRRQWKANNIALAGAFAQRRRDLGRRRARYSGHRAGARARSKRIAAESIWIAFDCVSGRPSLRLLRTWRRRRIIYTWLDQLCGQRTSRSGGGAADTGPDARLSREEGFAGQGRRIRPTSG